MELVVALVKQKTVKDGGNALALTDHRKPSLLGSSCHHIAGDMLWIGDTANRETGRLLICLLQSVINTTGVVEALKSHHYSVPTEYLKIEFANSLSEVLTNSNFY